jgi:hypothetical protein
LHGPTGHLTLLGSKRRWTTASRGGTSSRDGCGLILARPSGYTGGRATTGEANTRAIIPGESRSEDGETLLKISPRAPLNATERLRYYDLKRHWTKRIMPHLDDKTLNEILVRDFSKFTFGRWQLRFLPGNLPEEFETCDWRYHHRGRWPRYWVYVKHAACHWVVNFSLRLANLVEPQRPWRIITSEAHSTVWDGECSLFDFNFQALGVSATQCFELANDKVLAVGRPMRVNFAPPAIPPERRRPKTKAYSELHHQARRPDAPGQLVLF